MDSDFAWWGATGWELSGSCQTCGPTSGVGRESFRRDEERFWAMQKGTTTSGVCPGRCSNGSSDLAYMSDLSWPVLFTVRILLGILPTPKSPIRTGAAGTAAMFQVGMAQWNYWVTDQTMNLMRLCGSPYQSCHPISRLLGRAAAGKIPGTEGAT